MKKSGGKKHCWGDYSDFGWRGCHACMALNSGEGEVPEDELCPRGGVCRYKQCRLHYGRKTMLLRAIRIYLGMAIALPAILIWVFGLLLLVLASTIAAKPEWVETALGKRSRNG
jgi:hypothetical protein